MSDPVVNRIVEKMYATEPDPSQEGENMQVLVSFEVTSEYAAYVDYDELAWAWGKDAREWKENARPALPSKETLRNSSSVDVGQYADGAVSELLVNRGSEVDSRLPKIIDISEVP